MCSSDLVKVAHVDLSVPRLLRGDPGDSFDTAYKLVVEDSCISTSCYDWPGQEKQGRVRVPCSYATSERVVEVRDSVPCKYSITSDYLRGPADVLIGLVRFSSSEAEKVFIHRTEGNVKLLEHHALPVTLCIAAAGIEKCIQVKTQEGESAEREDGALIEEQGFAAERDERVLLAKNPLVEARIEVQEVVIAGEPCQVSLHPYATAQDRKSVV